MQTMQIIYHSMQIIMSKPKMLHCLEEEASGNILYVNSDQNSCGYFHIKEQSPEISGPVYISCDVSIHKGI